MFCFREKLDYSEAVHQIFIELNKVYEYVSREILYNILIQFGIRMKLVRLIKLFLNGTYSRVRVCKHLCDTFPIKNGLKKGDVLSSILFNFALEYTIMSVEGNGKGFKLNGKHHVLVYTDDVNKLGGSV
jgi:hypothetical protein